MKLLTHNMLACHIKGVKENQPFIIEVSRCLLPHPSDTLAQEFLMVSLRSAHNRTLHAISFGFVVICCRMSPSLVSQATETREVDADYNPDFLRHIYPRIEWPTLRTAAETLGAPRSR